MYDIKPKTIIYYLEPDTGIDGISIIVTKNGLDFRRSWDTGGGEESEVTLVEEKEVARLEFGLIKCTDVETGDLMEFIPPQAGKLTIAEVTSIALALR